MTDLFISATAALLLVLAVAQPTPVIPLAIQADIIAFCPIAPASQDASFRLQHPLDLERAAVDVQAPRDLAAVPAALGLDPDLLYTIALSASQDRPLSAGCLQNFTQDIVRPANQNLTQPAAPASQNQPQSRAVFVLAPALPQGVENATGGP